MEKAIPWRLEVRHDARGNLIVVEAERDVPFVIKRIFYVYGVPEGQSRGGHAHKACQQLLVCVNGYCRVTANGDEFWMAGPEKALYVPPGVRLDLDQWQPGTVLLALCSHKYDGEDYIEANQIP